MQARFTQQRRHYVADNIERSLRVIQKLAGKLEANHPQVDETMRLMVADGLAAMQYGQFGNGNIPDPTSSAAFTAKRVVEADGYGREVIVWRDHRPEDDRKRYYELADIATKAFEEWDTIRQRYMSANRDMWLRLDPGDFCRPHWFLMHREPDLQKLIPRRVTGDLCKDCNSFRVDNGRAPEPLEVEYFSKHLKWPHKLYDPKERRVV